MTVFLRFMSKGDINREYEESCHYDSSFFVYAIEKNYSFMRVFLRKTLDKRNEMCYNKFKNTHSNPNIREEPII